MNIVISSSLLAVALDSASFSPTLCAL